jgi:hypothetical protein
VRQVPTISSHQGTFVFATTFRFIAPESPFAVPPKETSKRAVPGVVTAQEMRPCAVILIILPA